MTSGSTPGAGTVSRQDVPGERLLDIVGGVPLRGEVTIGGAKNAALPLLAATLLTPDEVVLSNVPELSDIGTMVDLLKSLGAKAEWDRKARRIWVQAIHMTGTAAPPDLVARMRASFLVSGPLLGRFGEMSASTPGGCQLGARPVDVDVRGFRQMGAVVEADEQHISARSPFGSLRGTEIYMDYPSHTGTENLLMAAVLADGRTTIVNASCEPEIVALGNMLNRMGARISGLGSPILVIEGVDRLRGVSEAIIPDRLEAGTYAIAAAITGGEVTLHRVREAEMLPIRAKLEEAGARVWSRGESMLVQSSGELRAVEIQTLPFPGFPTDLQAAFGALLTQATGVSRIRERIFEDRLRYVDQLAAMGADVWVEKFTPTRYGSEALITGPTPLHGTRLDCLDIRAGAGIVLAGLAADGQTTIGKTFHLERGYQDLVPKLQSLGARITERTAS